MNKTEAVILCRYVKALCPSQAMDEFTPDAWADVMWDIDAADAKTAIQKMVRDEGAKFIDPGAVIGKVRRIRRDRVLDFGPVDPPSGLTDAEYLEWHRETTAAIASGKAKTPADLGLAALEPNPAGVMRLSKLLATTKPPKEAPAHPDHRDDRGDRP